MGKKTNDINEYGVGLEAIREALGRRVNPGMATDTLVG